MSLFLWSFDSHTSCVQSSSLLPVAPGVGQGPTSSEEAPTQIAPGLGYRWAGQGLARAEASWPHSRCGSTSGVHTSNLQVDSKPRRWHSRAGEATPAARAAGLLSHLPWALLNVEVISGPSPGWSHGCA